MPGLYLKAIQRLDTSTEYAIDSVAILGLVAWICHVTNFAPLFDA
jgi:hypothetical protein